MKEANTPVDPGEDVRRFIMSNYELEVREGEYTGRIFSHVKKEFIGTVSNGCPVHDGYMRIRTQGKTLKFHHVVFYLYHGRWPRLQVGHKNGNKYDMRPQNLEENTNAENQAERNQRLHWNKKEVAIGADA